MEIGYAMDAEYHGHRQWQHFKQHTVWEYGPAPTRVYATTRTEYVAPVVKLFNITLCAKKINRNIITNVYFNDATGKQVTNFIAIIFGSVHS